MFSTLVSVYILSPLEEASVADSLIPWTPHGMSKSRVDLAKAHLDRPSTTNDLSGNSDWCPENCHPRSPSCRTPGIPIVTKCFSIGSTFNPSIHCRDPNSLRFETSQRRERRYCACCCKRPAFVDRHVRRSPVSPAVPLRLVMGL